MDITLSEMRDIGPEENINLYRANQWSSADKPIELCNALSNSHSLITAWDNERLIGLGNAISDGVDTSTINGRLFLNLMASLAEYERELIRERTNAGLQSARAGGRPKGFTKEKVAKLLVMRSIYKDLTKTPRKNL
ncbi:recombinase family protein [Sphingobacterium sp. B16(2022)]|uniref:recombinase family protein n=1 Tax=Sphingobacterium sp. B16(2022) TaxID=2914044 RepID=UPI0019D26B86|nr:recombinase family protein [Sphingobacterium sp. B16(2022)]